MQVRDILFIHDAHTADIAQADILGDSFLLLNNPVYRNVKRFALDIGSQYVEASTQYLLLPFHQLNTIVSSKKIPYVPHGRLLRELEEQRPGVFSAEELRMPESYHLHESAHVIAEYFFKGVALTSPQHKILKAVVCESFANTVDALACVSAQNAEHRFFLEHNCYMHPQKRNIEVMSNLIAALGFRATFMLTLFAYIHANFMREEFSSDLIGDLVARYAPGVVMNKKIQKDCEALARIGEKLDPRFRVQTTEMYLKMEGFEGGIFEILNFDFMDVFATHSDFRRITEAMSDVIAPGMEGSK